MTATISQSAKALQAALVTIPGLRATEYLPDQINPPCAVVTPQGIRYHEAFRTGNPPINFLVTVFVGRMSDRVAQETLYGFMSATGAQSIRAAIEVDPTLDGVVQACVVTDAGNITYAEIGQVVYLTVDFQVTVHP